MNADLLHECRLIAWMPTYYMNDDLLQEGWLITWTKIYYMNKDLLHEKRLNIFLEVIQKCIWEIIKWRNQLHWLKLTMVHTLCLEGLWAYILIWVKLDNIKTCSKFYLFVQITAYHEITRVLFYYTKQHILSTKTMCCRFVELWRNDGISVMWCYIHILVSSLVIYKVMQMVPTSIRLADLKYILERYRIFLNFNREKERLC